MNLLIRCLELLLEGIVVDPSCLCCVVSRSFPRNFVVDIFLWCVAQLVSAKTLASCISVDIGDRTKYIFKILVVLSYGGLESDCCLFVYTVTQAQECGVRHRFQ